MDDTLEAVINYTDQFIERYFEEGERILDEHQLTILSIWLLEADVNNGGFDQYYWNSAGDLAIEAEQSLRKIGAHKVASIVSAANANFKDGKPSKNRELRQSELEKLENSGTLKLDSLDDKFYESRMIYTG